MHVCNEFECVILIRLRCQKKTLSEVPLLTFQRHSLYWTQVNLESNLWVSISDATDGSETVVILADEKPIQK